MKIFNLILVAAMISWASSGCSDFEDDRLDFQEVSPTYVKFESTKKKTLTEGKELKVPVVSQLMVYEDITVMYKVTGDYTTSGQVLIKAFSKGDTLRLSLPSNGVDDGTRVSKVTLESVTGGLAVGRAGVGTSFDLDVVD